MACRSSFRNENVSKTALRLTAIEILNKTTKLDSPLLIRASISRVVTFHERANVVKLMALLQHIAVNVVGVIHKPRGQFRGEGG